jgi:hypothetical protein
MDKITKILLALIAVGLLANASIFIYMFRPELGYILHGIIFLIYRVSLYI